MDMATTFLVWSLNLLVGLGLLTLGMVMLRRPTRVWVGVRVARTPEEVVRVRRTNLTTAPVLLFFGAMEVLSGALALAIGISPLMLAVLGLMILLAAIGTVTTAALFSR